MDWLADLIMMAQRMLDGEFDVDGFLAWKTLAFLCLLGLLGPLHYYTRNFGKVTQKTTPESLLAGEGILEAAKANIATAPERRATDGKLEPPVKNARFVPWLSRKKRWHPLQDFGTTSRV